MKQIDLSLLAKNVQDLIRRIGAEADAAGVRVYLVGGVVRELVLGYSSTDIDIAVEGDGIAFARRLAEKLKGKALFHDKFRTAALALRGGMVLDVVTARRETYACGGALPGIVPATLKEDLLRRDFTINAMAVSLNTDNFGSLRDDARGLKDIEMRSIRVMHQKSFVDDPTRILRAARYAVRFGFQFEALTEDLIDQALKADVFKTITAPRYFLELRRILEEKDPTPILDLLTACRAIRYVAYDADIRARLVKAPGEWESRLAVFLQGMKTGDARALLAAFNVSRSAQKKIL